MNINPRIMRAVTSIDMPQTLKTILLVLTIILLLQAVIKNFRR